METTRRLIVGLLPLMAAGCAAGTAKAPFLSPAPTATVQARGETAAVETANADAADDPAIWRNPADPAASLIVATDKKAGLHVYGLDGRDRFFTPAGQVNNVDLRDMGAAGILVAASDRTNRAQAVLALFRLDPATARLTPIARLPVGPGEAYGVCLYRAGDALHAFNVLKDGTIHQMALDLSGPAPTGRIVRTMKLATQSEACVADERTGRLYVAEEDAGIWRFDARADGATTGTRIASADRYQIVADTEGLAIAAEGSAGDGYLLVSSQGDNAYAVYRLRDDSYVGRFRITAGVVGATEETDGIELATGDFGPGFPGGLFVAQDGHNAPRAQNFKLVAWADIKTALGLTD
jgi:3-phytase